LPRFSERLVAHDNVKGCHYIVRGRRPCPLPHARTCRTK
jgi:hypothetical protein